MRVQSGEMTFMWPTTSLRNQLLISVLICVALMQIILIVAFGWLAARDQSKEISQRIERVSTTLDESHFPVTNRVLEQMRGLTGAEFLLVGGSGEVIASTGEVGQTNTRWWEAIPVQVTPHDLGIEVAVGGRSYLASAISRRDLSQVLDSRLIVLFPQARIAAEQWQAIGPVIWLGGLSMLVTAVLISWLATRVTRPIRELREQVELIADGQFQSLPIDSSTKEVRDLAVAVHQMTEKLAGYETKIRATERLRLWALLRGGIAHQLRNAMTGAQLALELHQGQCPQGDDESLQVARRQFKTIEHQLQQFLQSPRETALSQQTIDVDEWIQNCSAVARPLAEHRGVEMRQRLSGSGGSFAGDPELLEQMLLNLIHNGIDAAGAWGAAMPVDRAMHDPDSARSELAKQTQAVDRLRGWVEVEVQLEPDRVTVLVKDNGAGPSAEISPQLFEPFGTDKVGGVGLGLWMSKQIVELHGGQLTWLRQNEVTCFVVKLPR
jgi:signal transduction histidine kinase